MWYDEGAEDWGYGGGLGAEARSQGHPEEQVQQEFAMEQMDNGNGVIVGFPSEVYE